LCYLDLEQPSLAALYLQMALAAYRRWGAEAKCRQLREAYATLLTDMAEPSALPPLVMPVSAGGVDEGSADSGNVPEPATIQAAAQALAGLLDIDQLLPKLMTLALQSTGAQRGLLISERNQELQIDVSALTMEGTFRIEQNIQTITADKFPLGVLLYVARTLSALRIDDAVNDEQFAGDVYLHSRGVKSILCLPLYKEPEQMTAFLYLEHSGISAAFTPEHATAAQILATHAAVALHNARLHHDLQQQLDQRRQAEARLQQALNEVAALKEKLATENVYLKQELQENQHFHEVIGHSQILRQVLQHVELVAATDTSVLILGETGTGKELIARALHQLSARSERPLIKVNCAALPATLIESELFGHEKGAFTGAVSRQIGRFELADGGTLFLDEIGDLPLELQAKLLRVLQEGEFERIGSGKTYKADVRVIAATNREIEQLSRQELFRADLYYRLSTFPIRLPALRERREDIPLLVWYFISKHQNRLGRRIDKITAASMTALQEYDWPGNIRELENIIERSMILSRGDGNILQVDGALLPPAASAATAVNPSRERTGPQQPGQDLKQIEREHILGVLEQCDWKIKGSGNAAGRLGLAPSTLRWKMKNLGIERP
jgi:transcriptional regulator with GAF, ATPase, and Fis domain